MDCTVWESTVVRTPDDGLPPPVRGFAEKENEIEEEAKERIRNVRLENSKSDREEIEETQHREEGSDEDEDSEGDSEANCAYLDGWEKSLEKVSELRGKQRSNCLKERQLGLIAAWASQAEQARIRVLEETKERGISLGVMRTETAHLLESVEGPYHSNIKCSREQYFSRKKEEDQRMLENKAREYYQNEWVFVKKEIFENFKGKKKKQRISKSSV